MTLRKPLPVLLALLLLAFSAASLLAASGKKRKGEGSVAQMNERQRALHALNRLTFGPRPGDEDRVLAIGVDKWIGQQLEPAKINDSALDARLAPFATLRMSTRELVENFPPPWVAKAISEGKMSMPSDPDKESVYQAAVDRHKQRTERKNEAAAQQADLMQTPADELSSEKKEQRRVARLAAHSRALELLALAPGERMTIIEKMGTDERRMFWAGLSPQERDQLTGGLSPRQKETLLALENPVLVVNGELMAAKLLRAAYSERQLQEVMTDFWFNHFNVFIGKGADRYMVTAYERDVIRPNVFGKFKDLLLATAKSPAMLWYLDNWQSVGPHSVAAVGVPNRPPRIFCGIFRPCLPLPSPMPGKGEQKAPRGLNENYAREVMELQTLGVDGGYTQQDVTELARMLTGWTLTEPRKGGGFEFNERRHEPGTKVFLGHKFHEDGMREGEKALDLLAHHPATARFISTKLAQRFVSDAPPISLIDKMAETFRASDGDIREVLRTMFRSPEFWAADVYRAKVKTPLEFVVSCVRVTGADVQHPRSLIESLNRMGMPLYGAQPPTGYSMKSEAWVNSSALLARMNFALTLGASRLQGVAVDSSLAFGNHSNVDSVAEEARLEQTLLNGEVSPETHATIAGKLNNPFIGRQAAERKLGQSPPSVNPGGIVGLLLGSPEFQRR